MSATTRVSEKKADVLVSSEVYDGTEDFDVSDSDEDDTGAAEAGSSEAPAGEASSESAPLAAGAAGGARAAAGGAASAAEGAAASGPATTNANGSAGVGAAGAAGAAGAGGAGGTAGDTSDPVTALTAGSAAAAASEVGGSNGHDGHDGDDSHDGHDGHGVNDGGAFAGGADAMSRSEREAMRDAAVEEATAMKEKGNTYFKKKDLSGAIDAYTAALDAMKAFVEEDDFAMEDATAIDRGPTIEFVSDDEDGDDGGGGGGGGRAAPSGKAGKAAGAAAAAAAAAAADASDKAEQEAIRAKRAATTVCRPQDRALMAVLHNNRAAAGLALAEDLDAVVDDCKQALDLDASLVKAWYRMGVARRKQGKLKDAASTLAAAATLCATKLAEGQATEDEVAPMRRAVQKEQQLVKKAVARAREKRAARQQRGWKAGGAPLGGLGGLYDDQEDLVVPAGPGATEAERVEVESRRWLQRIRDFASRGDGNASGTTIEGEFKKLLEPRYFRSTVYPGRRVDKDSSLPRSLQALLKDDRYTNFLMDAMPAILANGAQVLMNVKAKGAAMGDTMPPETEAMLYPQVMMEAFGRQVKAIVDDVHRQAMRQATHVQVEVASPYSVTASWDQVSEELLHGVVDEARGFGTQPSFLGSDWAGLVRKDAARYASTEQLDALEGTDGGRFAWLEPADITETYPALAELMQRLAGLPSELNKKMDWRLKRAINNSIMLTHIPAGGAAVGGAAGAAGSVASQLAELAAASERAGPGGSELAQKKRWDGGHGRSDSGIKLSCVYFLAGGAGKVWSKSQGGIVRVHQPPRTEEDARKEEQEQEQQEQQQEGRETEDKGAGSAAPAAPAAPAPAPAPVVLPAETGTTVEVDPLADSVLMYRSRQVATSLTAIEEDSEVL
eukprot:g2069.t1